MAKNYLYTFIFTVLSIFSSGQLKADAEEGSYAPELVRLYESDLVIDANYVRQTKDFFWIKVNSVIRDTKYGIKKGDYIRVINIHSGGCGFPFNIANYSRGRYYLQKNTNTWGLYRSQTSSVCSVRSDSTYFTVGQRLYYDNANRLHKDLIEFQKCFGMYNEHWNFYNLISDSLISNKALHNKVIRYFEENNRLAQQLEVVIQDPEPHDVVQAIKTVQHCSFMDKQPEYIGGDSALLSFIDKNLVYPLTGSGIQGTVYLQLNILEDGSVGEEIKVARGVHDLLDQEAIRVVGLLPKWKPAKMRGHSEVCKMIIPIRFKE